MRDGNKLFFFNAYLDLVDKVPWNEAHSEINYIYVSDIRKLIICLGMGSVYSLKETRSNIFQSPQVIDKELYKFKRGRFLFEAQ